MEPPCAKTLRRWVADLESGGMSPTALRNGYRHCGRHAPLRDPDIATLAHRHAMRYTSETQSNMRGLYKNLLSDIAKLNATRLDAGLKALRPPCDKVFFDKIRSLSAYAVCAGRKGLARARTTFAVVQTGLDVTRIGERIEIDEWLVQLQALLIDAELWELLTPEEQEGVVRERWWLSVAIDTASRCILGMRLSPSADSTTALLTLAMVVNDKGAFADAVGALSPWDMRCGPESIVTDTESAYISDVFRDAVFALGIKETPPASLAAMRADIERFFGTVHTQLISRFTGRTSENTVALDNYPSEARASVTMAELALALTRYVVDVYHNTEHDGLNGETPRNAWIRLIKLYSAPPIPQADIRRTVFGIKVTRALTTRGVRFLNLFYQSLELQGHRRQVGDCDVEISVDPANIGWISVKIGDGHMTVPCVQPRFAGVRAEDWIAARLDLRRRYGQQAALSQHIVFKALDAIEAMAAAAVSRANIGSTMLTADELDRAEYALTISWAPPPDTEAEAGEPGDEADLLSDVIYPPPSSAATPPEATPLNPPPRPKPKWTLE